ncbi:MAG: FAD-dependent oxidoreductase [bacterium]
MKYDLAIIGGGPAGVAAGVYASRKQLKTVFITESFGGQSIVSDGIENWIGTIKIPGEELATSLKKHLEAYAKDIVDIKEGERAVLVEKFDEGFRVTTAKNSYETKNILLTAGSRRRKLDAIGADKFEHKGVMYCASCDGPLFSGMDVVVVGGGNAGFESMAQLSAYAKSVTLVHRRNEYRADPITVQKVLSLPNVKAITNVEILEVKGEAFEKGMFIKDNETGVTTELEAQGIFVEIGAIPNTDIVKSLVELNDMGAVKIDPLTQQTSRKGIWAAGDCTNVLYHQNNIAVGDGVKALEDIYVSLHTK